MNESNESSYKSAVGPAGVSSAQHLEAHLRLHRSTSVCGTCGKRFLSASHLDKHRVVHTNTR
jgi:hypothetical protein